MHDDRVSDDLIRFDEQTLRDPDLRDPQQVVRHLRDVWRLTGPCPYRRLLVVYADEGRPALHVLVDDLPRELSDGDAHMFLWPFLHADADGADVLVAMLEHGSPTPAVELHRLRAEAARGLAVQERDDLGLWLVGADGLAVRRAEAPVGADR